jgi:hypothetical protein
VSALKSKPNSSQHHFMSLLRKLFILAFVLYLARLAVGFGTATYHYKNTPTYAEYLATTPVANEFFQQQFAMPTALHSGKEWQQGALPADDWQKDGDTYLGGTKFELEIKHGEDLMLRLDQEVEYLLVPDSCDHLGFRWTTPALHTSDDLRAVVLIWLDESALVIGPDTGERDTSIVDIFLMAGDAEPEVHYLRMSDRANAYASQSLELPVDPANSSGSTSVHVPLWRMATGIITELGPLPEEGLFYFCSHRMDFSWQKIERTKSSSGHYAPKLFVNTSEYSYEMTSKATAMIDREVFHSQSSSRRRSNEWNDRIW